MYSCRYIWKQIAFTERQVVANLAVQWAGAEKYLLEQYAWEGDLHSRLWIERDPEQLRYFYLMLGQGWKIPQVSKEAWQRGQRLDMTWAYRWAPVKDGDADGRPDIWELKRSELEGGVKAGEIERVAASKLPKVTYFLDEIQNIFPAQVGMGSDPALRFWLTQQSKLSVDVICTTQEPEWIEKSFRDLADDWMFINNWGRERRYIFRGPKIATWAKYSRLPKGPGCKPIQEGTFGINPQGIGDTYDTSGGVGIEGGLDADKQDKVGGLHWWMFPIFIGLACILFYFGSGWAIAGVSSLTRGWSHRATDQPKVVPGPNVVPLVATNGPLAMAVPGVLPYPGAQNIKKDAPKKEPAKAQLRGVIVWKGQCTAFFDDGARKFTVSNRSDGFGGVLRDVGGRYAGVRWNGEEYWLDQR